MGKENRYGSSKINLGELLHTTTTQHDTNKPNPPTPASKQHKPPEQPTTVRRLSVNEYIAVASMLFASIILFTLSIPKILYNLTTSFQPLTFLLNTLYLVLAIGTLTGALLLLKKETHLEHIADETFDNVIYQRLKPVLQDVAEVQTGLHEVQSELHMVNINIERLHSKKETKPSAAHTTPIAPTDTTNATYMKYIILINITLAIFLFMLTYPLSYIPYTVTLIYLIWWATITAEYKLWSIDAVWMWVFLPILILPIYTIIMSAYLLDYQLFGSLFIGLFFYITAYYSWSTYTIKGVLPLEIDTAINDLKKHFETQKETTKTQPITTTKQFTLQAPPFNKNTIRLLSISLACILFAIVWFGYALENQLIGGANWQTIGIQDFHWKSLYSYALSLLGILLLAISVLLSRGQDK